MKACHGTANRTDTTCQLQDDRVVLTHVCAAVWRILFDCAPAPCDLLTYVGWFIINVMLIIIVIVYRVPVRF